MGGDRDNCGNEGMQRETRVAASTGTRGGGWDDRSFPHRSGGQKDNDRGKTREFKQRDSKETQRHGDTEHGEYEGFSSNSAMR